MIGKYSNPKIEGMQIINLYQKKNLFFYLRSGLVEECSYFVGNVLVQVRHIFLSDYLVLFLLKPRGVRVLGNKKKKKSDPNRGSPLNSN